MNVLNKNEVKGLSASSVSHSSSSAEAKKYDKVDQEYFDGYSSLGIHEDMLKDKARTLGYRDAIMGNKQDFEGKVVLDVGCGTGILSLFCADAGARKVYAVDASEMADYARKIVEKNDKKGVIEIIKGKIEEIEIPEKVDVIVSEWMGYFLLYESMLHTVIFARNKWFCSALLIACLFHPLTEEGLIVVKRLKEGGKLYPSHARLYLTPFRREDYFEDRIDYWKDVYGKDFSALIPLAKKYAFGEPAVDLIYPEDEIAIKPCVIQDLDISKVEEKDLQSWGSPFKFESMIRAGINGFASWFEVDFCGAPSGGQRKFTLSTAPKMKETHWAQTLFYFDEPLPVEQDDIIQGKIAVKMNKENRRFLDVHFEWVWTAHRDKSKTTSHERSFLLS